MPDTSEVTSDYSGSLTSTSSEDEENEDSSTTKNENSALLWATSGSKKSPLIMFRPESLITRDKKLKSIGEQYHLAYKMVKTESKLVRSVLAAYGFHEVHPNSAEFNLMWTGAHLKPFSLRSLQDFQKVNHFPRSYEITRKDRLYKNIERMAHTKGTKNFDFIPKSYLMPTEYQEFCAAYVKEKGSWIVKPIASSRGRGIYLINNPNQVPLEDNIMVCKYINNPLLIDGFKFDVRVYVAITSYDPLLIYLFEEGLTRFATVKYEKAHKHLKNQMMHLTNYSINKKSHDYVRCEDPDVEDYGNKWSMSAMLRYLKQEGIDTSTLMSRIEAVIIKSILAATLPIATACKMFVPNKENCIELYGFDILVDENLKPWILEGNLSPSLACDAPLDLKIKSSMIADFFSIAGFRCVDPMSKRPAKKPFELLQRPYSAQRSTSFVGGSSNRGVKRPSSAGYKEIVSGASKISLSTEETRALAMAKEQYQRRGSFIRIFPTAETWEQYGSFLEYKSNLNHLLAQKLFPDRTKSAHSSYPSSASRARSVNNSQMLGSRRQVISERFLQYERKLFSLEAHKKRRALSTTQKKSKFRETPVGVDNRFRKKILRARHSSSEEESNDDVEEEESETTSPSKCVKSAKAKPSLSSGDAAVPSKPIKQDSKISTDKISKSKLFSSNPLNGVPDKLNQTATAESTSSKAFKGQSSSLKSPPVQRVYMYKSNSPVESEPGSPEKQLALPEMKLDSMIDDSEQSYAIGKLPSNPPASSLSQEIAKKIEMINQKQMMSRTTRNQKIVNVLSVLRSGGNLGKLQARQAFSAYLSRVQHRLRIESEGHVQDPVDDVYKQEEQMELVLKFLKRAAGNLCQSLSVVVPSRRLPIIDRKRILAKQLAEFVRIYNKESEILERKRNIGMEKAIGLIEGDHRQSFSQSISDSDFRAFILNASESSLEEVLTAYTHKNKSASVFLGAGKPKNPRCFEKDNGSVLPDSPTTSMLGQQPARGYSVPSTPTGGLHSHHPVNEELADKAHHSGLTSLPQTTSLYNAKPSGMSQLGSTRRSSSAKPFMPSAGVYNSSQSSLRPGSTSTRQVTGSIHYHTAANQEAISDALQKLTERQAARQYSAPVQLTSLSKQLSSLNLSNSGQHHKMGSGEMHLVNSPQRTSSLSDLASIDPSVQSMMDPGLQKFSRNASADSTYEQNELPVVSALQDVNHSKSTQMLSQQSNNLLQQSKAKHQAMLAQMLDVWRNKQQAEMKSGKYMSKGLSSFPCSNSSEKRNGMYRCQPFSTAHSHSSPTNGSRLHQAIDSVEKDSAYDNTNFKEMLLLERTEKLIHCHTSERKAYSGKNSFLKQVVSANRSGVPQSYNRKSSVTPDSNRNKLAQIKPICQQTKKQTYSSSTFAKSRQLPTSDTAPLSQSSADRYKKAETARNIMYYENILQEINSLFEMGELPTKQWKDAYKRPRK